MTLTVGVLFRRLHNKGVYVRVGLQKISHSRSLHREIRLQVEQREVELPSIEGLIFINIPRCQWLGLWPQVGLQALVRPPSPVRLSLGAAGAQGPTCGALTATRGSRSHAWMTGC